MTEESLQQLSEFIRLYYDYNPTGGTLHITLDDGNLDDESLAFCLARAREEKDYEGEAIVKRLLDLPLEIRQAMYDHEYTDSGGSFHWGSGLAVPLLTQINAKP